jgi:predicted regulator of Ras-like GTPase activity (Roadblock/LC7/MglB family)
MPAIIATSTLLSDARKAYHALMTGTSARVVVDQNGERVEFVAANKQALLAYITQLEQQLGVPCGTEAYPSSAYHPATFVF